MLTVLFEALPQAGRHSTYRDCVAAIQRAVQGVAGPVESAEYRSITRDGWILSLTLWGESATAEDLPQIARLDLTSTAGLLDYRFRAGNVALDTSIPTAEPGPEQSSERPVLTVLSGPSVHALDNSTTRRNIGPLVLGARTEGLAAWEVFESLAVSASVSDDCSPAPPRRSLHVRVRSRLELHVPGLAVLRRAVRTAVRSFSEV